MFPVSVDFWTDDFRHDTLVADGRIVPLHLTPACVVFVVEIVTLGEGFICPGIPCRRRSVSKYPSTSQARLCGICGGNSSTGRGVYLSGYTLSAVLTLFIRLPPVAYPGILFWGGGSTNSVEDRENRDVGGR